MEYFLVPELQFYQLYFFFFQVFRDRQDVGARGGDEKRGSVE